MTGRIQDLAGKTVLRQDWNHTILAGLVQQKMADHGYLY